MIVLVKLIIAHFIGDFLLQPKSWVEEKEKFKAKSIKFYLHLLIHGILTVLLLMDFNHWLLAVFLMAAHGIIDALKLYAQKENNRSRWFFIDQSLHILSILLLWFLCIKPELNFESWSGKMSIWIYAAAMVFITFVSGIVIRELLSGWSKALNEANKESLNYAGKYIGILERLFVFVFVITDNWEGIGFLLAAKSVFRFGDLKESKDRQLTEYMLIGTLLSFGIAVASGMVVQKLIVILK